MEWAHMRIRCERCDRKMRSKLTSGEYVDGHTYFVGKTVQTIYPSDIDGDVCARCGEDIIAACWEHEDGKAATP